MTLPPTLRRSKLVPLRVWCRIHSVPYRTAYRWVRSGHLPSVRRGTRWYISRSTEPPEIPWRVRSGSTTT